MTGAPAPAIEGLEVEEHVLPGEAPYAARGAFLVRSSGEAAELEIVSVVLDADGRRAALDGFHVYADDTELGARFRVEAGAAMRLDVSFPFVRLRAPDPESDAVVATFTCAGRRIETASPLRFTFETGV